VSASNTVTVSNANPAVTSPATSPSTIDEGQSTTFSASFSDAGWNDTYTASVDWGFGPAEAVAANVTTQGSPGVSDTGSVSGTHAYIDDGVFTITGTVNDDDSGSNSGSTSVTVNNVPPTAAINESGTVVVNGVPTIISSAGSPVALSGNSTDPGSDDLTLTWDWDDGAPAPDVTVVSLHAPPNPDPDPSPDGLGRNVTNNQSHAFSDACIYQVGFGSADDDGGSTADSVAVLITGNEDEGEPSGYWSHQYRRQGSTDFDDATLTCYLEIVDFASDVFHEVRNVATFARARSLLFTQGTSVSKRDQLDRDLLTTWLNFANGAVGWNELVDTNRNGAPDTVFHVALETAEAVRLNPASTGAQFDAQRAILQSITDTI
jgi:hypothetical protein